MRTLLSTVLLRKLPAPTPRPGLMFIVCSVSMDWRGGGAGDGSGGTLRRQRGDAHVVVALERNALQLLQPRLSAGGVCACRISGRHRAAALPASGNIS
jgi:hypothetical protein